MQERSRYEPYRPGIACLGNVANAGAVAFGTGAGGSVAGQLVTAIWDGAEVDWNNLVYSAVVTGVINCISGLGSFVGAGIKSTGLLTAMGVETRSPALEAKNLFPICTLMLIVQFRCIVVTKTCIKIKLWGVCVRKINWCKVSDAVFLHTYRSAFNTQPVRGSMILITLCPAPRYNESVHTVTRHRLRYFTRTVAIHIPTDMTARYLEAFTTYYHDIRHNDSH